MEINTSQVFDIVMTLLGVMALVALSLLGMWINDYLRRRMTKEQYDFAVQVVAELVGAAEQQAQAGSLPKEDRIQWVIERLQRRLPFLDMVDAQAMIESAVRKVNLENKNGHTKS